jgi:hypothetical protein
MVFKKNPNACSGDAAQPLFRYSLSLPAPAKGLIKQCQMDLNVSHPGAAPPSTHSAIHTFKITQK